MDPVLPPDVLADPDAEVLAAPDPLDPDAPADPDVAPEPAAALVEPPLVPVDDVPVPVPISSGPVDAVEPSHAQGPSATPIHKSLRARWFAGARPAPSAAARGRASAVRVESSAPGADRILFVDSRGGPCRRLTYVPRRRHLPHPELS